MENGRKHTFLAPLEVIFNAFCTEFSGECDGDSPGASGRTSDFCFVFSPFKFTPVSYPPRYISKRSVCSWAFCFKRALSCVFFPTCSPPCVCKRTKRVGRKRYFDRKPDTFSPFLIIIFQVLERFPSCFLRTMQFLQSK